MAPASPPEREPMPAVTVEPLQRLALHLAGQLPVPVAVLFRRLGDVPKPCLLHDSVLCLLCLALGSPLFPDPLVERALLRRVEVGPARRASPREAPAVDVAARTAHERRVFR